MPEGLHLFDLGEPLDYAPDSQEVEVTGTSAQEPLVIDFVPLAPMLAAASRRGTRAKRAKKKAQRAPAPKTAKARKPAKATKPAKRRKP
jgi:hypothetical protein